MARWGDRALTACGLLVVLMMLAIAGQVALNALGISLIASFPAALPLLGEAFTLNGLMELQWHLLAAVALLPAGLAWRRNAHVRVDFLYQRFGPRAKATVELLGHLAFTLPFLILCIPASWRFMQRAIATGEVSRDGGLADRWLVKGLIPLGLSLLLIVVLLDFWPQARRLWRRR